MKIPEYYIVEQIVACLGKKIIHMTLLNFHQILFVCSFAWNSLNHANEDARSSLSWFALQIELGILTVCIWCQLPAGNMIIQYD